MRRSSRVEDAAGQQAILTLKTELQVYMEFMKAGTKRIEEMDVGPSAERETRRVKRLSGAREPPGSLGPSAEREIWS